MTEAKPAGVRRWLTTLDHADIGRLYLGFGALAGLWGGLDAMMIRTHLLTPGADVWPVGTYDALFTTHGLTMLFMFATPVLFGLANVVLPPLVGAEDMAFPRANALGFWLLPPALCLLRAGSIAEILGLAGIGPPAVGWTLYPPLSVASTNPGVDLALLGLHLSGLATVVGAINVVVTVIESRTVPWADLDVFSWTMLTTGGLVIFAFPVLGSAILMLLLDRNVGTTFFTTPGGGPILWQHLFWFFGHPEVYILILPPMGIISLVLPKFAGRELFGFEFVVYSTLAIGVLSFGVWAHHMFATGLDPAIRASFMAVTLAIAVPSAVKTFNWIATLWTGRIRLDPPMLFCLGAIANFVLGGVTGVFLASIPVDLVLHGTAYVVGHFHFMLVGVGVFAAFAGCYYWFPLVTGRRCDERLARVHFWLTMGGTVVAFTLMLLLGMAGLPRRMATYPVRFAPLQGAATVAAFVIGFAQLLALWNVVRSLRVGERAGPDPWNLRESGFYTREWARMEDRRTEK